VAGLAHRRRGSASRVQHLCGADAAKEVAEAAFRADKSVEAAYISKLSLSDRRALADLLRLLILTMDDTQS
jgi:hypothetical protein